MALVIAHEFKDCDDEGAANNNKEAVICIGSTGTGKSSLIRLYCGDHVAVGHDTHSQTTKSTLFQQLNSNQKYWLDSQGANDSNGSKDEKVLTDIMRCLYRESISKIKVVWCVSGDLCREKQEFQTQAKFIQSLGNDVWNHCIILKKKGKPMPKKMDGVLAAANRYGANLSRNDTKRLLGFKALQYEQKNADDDDDDDDTLELLNEIEDEEKRREQYKKYGYLRNDEIVQQVDAKLAGLRSLCVEFQIQQCVKCGVKGDPRFVYAPCHAVREQFHPEPLELYHDGDLVYEHFGVRKQTEIREIEWYHPHDFPPNFFKEGKGWLALHITDEKWKRAQVYPCCKRDGYSSGCISRYVTRTGSTKWSCCDQLCRRKVASKYIHVVMEADDHPVASVDMSAASKENAMLDVAVAVKRANNHGANLLDV
eukprot:CAMPEP_0197025856 /NCGR_PEP_ID=MMETSP1384-20130603/6066_1 /TAXON_ID=29189 /ORGANISM="Ammonia sp." /LENGTH=423 /DNA_ID=CAMNT_0042454433 /DNA_START=20 /DNA_END=1292 /DNA_ORIENTATION=+